MSPGAPQPVRLQIGLFGRVNAGKSSLLNYLAGQDVAVTSPVPGTTTDVVEKPMELPPLGPVLFLDTGGLDDASELGSRRTERTARAFDRADVAVLVVEPNRWTPVEDAARAEARRRDCPVLVVVNKADLEAPRADWLAELRARVGPALVASCLDAEGRERTLTEFTARVGELARPGRAAEPPLLGDLLPAGGLLVMVVPIDLQAPKGRLILPQVQAIRDALDHDAGALVVKDREYAAALARLGVRPDLVVCDSQVVLKTVADTPPGVRCTTFSILFARHRGDLAEFARGAAALGRLRPGDRVLVAEACTHHALEDDIGRVKIPRWLRQYVGGDLAIDTVSGRDFPADLAAYRAAIHCGSCMLNRREMLARVRRAREAGVPITNYGVAISFLQGVLDRVLEPFPAAREAAREARRETSGRTNG